MGDLLISRDILKTAALLAVYNREFSVDNFHFLNDAIWRELVEPTITVFYMLSVSVDGIEDGVVQVGVGTEASPGYPSSVFYHGREFVKGLAFYEKGGTPLSLWASNIVIDGDYHGDISASIEYVGL